MRGKKPRRAVGARPERAEMGGISLQGRSVIVATCVGQLGSLLPHVVVPSILAGFLIPEWHLTGAQAGFLASSGAAGYMLTVPLLATLTDRIDARKILIAGSLGTILCSVLAMPASILGMTMAADPNYRGATMAMHSTVGFSLSALGAWVVGIALDMAGGPLSPSAWTAAFSVLAAGILLGPVALYWSRRMTPQP
jgi:MFS family permease